MSDPIQQGDRLTRIEAVVERLEVVVNRLAESHGKPNWSMLGVLIPATLVVIGGAATVIWGPISANANDIQELKTELSQQIRWEIERNNRLEREMGGVMMINELYKLGKLNLKE